MKKKLAIVFGCLAVIAAAVFGILLGRAYYDRRFYPVDGKGHKTE